MIFYDPSADADRARGSVSDALVEGIDLVPTFIAPAGGAVPDHIVEGRSLLPFLRARRLRLSPPLVVTETHIEQIVDTIRAALRDLTA